MASKRMIANDIVGSDAFTGMSVSAQALYMQILMNADDDGFCDNANKLAILINAKKNAINELFDRGFIIGFAERRGLVVVKHWLMHNTIRTERYKVTNYVEFARQLEIKPNKSYTKSGEMLLDEFDDSGNVPWRPLNQKDDSEWLP